MYFRHIKMLNTLKQCDMHVFRLHIKLYYYTALIFKEIPAWPQEKYHEYAEDKSRLYFLEKKIV